MCRGLSTFEAPETSYRLSASKSIVNLEDLVSGMNNSWTPATYYNIVEGSDIMFEYVRSDKSDKERSKYLKARKEHNSKYKVYPISLDDGSWVNDTEVVIMENGEYFFLQFKTKDEQQILEIWPTTHEQLHKFPLYVCEELGTTTKTKWETELKKHLLFSARRVVLVLVD